MREKVFAILGKSKRFYLHVQKSDILFPFWNISSCAPEINCGQVPSLFLSLCVEGELLYWMVKSIDHNSCLALQAKLHFLIAIIYIHFCFFTSQVTAVALFERQQLLYQQATFSLLHMCVCNTHLSNCRLVFNSRFSFIVVKGLLLTWHCCSPLCWSPIVLFFFQLFHIHHLTKARKQQQFSSGLSFFRVSGVCVCIVPVHNEPNCLSIVWPQCCATVWKLLGMFFL